MRRVTGCDARWAPKTAHVGRPGAREWEDEDMEAQSRSRPGRRERPAAELADKQEAKLAEVRRLCPTKARPFEMAYSGRSKAAALKAFCIWCMGYDSTVVGRCSAEDCPLWRFRPYRRD